MKCKAEVRMETGFARYRQCSRNAVCDGYCTQHHPSVIARKQKERDKKFESRFNKEVSLRRDAMRYRWLRDGNGYVPEEEGVRGGEDLDKLCDAGIDGDFGNWRKRK